MLRLKKIATIGVYGFTDETFFEALTSGGVQLLVDVRARRGVRGSEYAFANSLRLQERLAQLGIGYMHCAEVAPSDDIRSIQKRADAAQNVAYRQRPEVSPEFASAYTSKYLTSANLASLTAKIANDYDTIALLCVEREPEACHRSLLAKHLSAVLGVEVVDLTP